MAQGTHIPASGRRKHDRYFLETDVALHVVLPEKARQPISLTGRSVDVSFQAMQVYFHNIPLALYEGLFKGLRLLQISDPRTGKQLELTGHILWIHIRKSDPLTKNCSCSLGIFFDEDQDTLKQYQAFIQSVPTNS